MTSTAYPAQSRGAVPLGRRSKRWILARPGVARLGVIALLFIAWEVAARFFVDKLFLSPPSLVFTQIHTVFETTGVPNALRVSAYEIGVAFVMSVAIGPASKIAFGVSHGIFPIIVTVVAGVQNIKPILLTSAKSMGASRWHIFRWVIFPHMIPSFFAGMRLGMTGVLLGVLLAELYVSTAGIGYYTTLFTQSFNPTKLLGLISILAAMAILLNEIVRRAELHYGRWREA